MVRDPELPGRGAAGRRSGRLSRRGAALVLGLLALLTLCVPASQGAAQYPTPVQGPLPEGGGSIRAELGLENTAVQVQQLWGQLAPQIAAGLDLQQPRPVEVVLLTGSTFQRWTRNLLPDWGLGFANWPAGPIVLNVDGIAEGQKTLAEVLAHEMSHVFLGQRVEGAALPRWFIEGVAQAQSGEWRFLDTIGLVRSAAFGRIPSLSRLANGFPQGGNAASVSYRLSLRAVLDLEKRLEDRGGYRSLVTHTAESQRFDRSFLELTGLTLAEYDEVFASRLRTPFGWFSVLASSTTLWGAMTLLFLAGVARAYVRRWRRLREMEAEERWLDPGEA